MKIKSKLKIVVSIAIVLLSLTANAGDTVKIKQGTLRGQTTKGITSFLGIPFAKPPIGDLRWRAPQEPESWTGIRLANTFCSDCIQGIRPGLFEGRKEPSEDCLYLNVWRPEKDFDEPLPVMVWIYGGAWLGGGSSFPEYNGYAIASKDIVFVSFNYRVGRLGFFAHPALSEEFPDEPKGNYGLMDQIAALKWIKENISAFGGDPNNVTIFGESAGGGSVEALLQSPMAAGLFHKAISQSSGPTGVQTARLIGEDQPGRPSAESFGLAFAKAKGIEGKNENALNLLRALPAEQFIDFTEGLPEKPDVTNVRWGGPMIDGKVLTQQEYKSYREGSFNKVPLMTGATRGDLPGPIVAGRIDGVGTTRESAVARFDPYQDDVLLAFDPNNKMDVEELAYKSGSAWFMIEPARFVASMFAAQDLPVYHYRFSYIKESMKDRWKYGTPHFAEVHFLFNTLEFRYRTDVTPEDQNVANMMLSYWTNFAKTGNPNGDGLKTWPKYSKSTDLILDFLPDGSIYSGPDPMKEQLDAVGKAAEGRK